MATDPQNSASKQWRTKHNVVLLNETGVLGFPRRVFLTRRLTGSVNRMRKEESVRRLKSATLWTMRNGERTLQPSVKLCSRSQISKLQSQSLSAGQERILIVKTSGFLEHASSHSIRFVVSIFLSSLFSSRKYGNSSRMNTRKTKGSWRELRRLDVGCWYCLIGIL